MTCPHCQIGIHEGFGDAQVCIYAAKGAEPMWSVIAQHQQCPECNKIIIRLQFHVPGQRATEMLVFPRRGARPVPSEVPEPYRGDFTEASEALAYSEKASAALSRRCLQAVLRDKAQVKHSTLYNEIDEAIGSGKLPPDIAEALHALREFGNFAAHPMKDAATGSIVDVEAGEAEWMLDVLERLFDFCFVGPALTAKRKAELNAKLTAVGKKPIS
jgi:hypothetical protein